MGCGASILTVGGPQVDVKGLREYSAAITNLRLTSSMCSDAPVAAGQLKVFQQDFKDMREFYAIGRLLGKGQFGTCRLVTEKFTGAKYACKSISKRKLCSLSDVMDVRREVQIMHHLAGHPNIVNIKDVYEDRGFVHLVEELCTGGELFDSIIERGHYSERDAASAFRCIASVVSHCHDMGVMHRDIKPENFLLSSRSADATIKGTDFGLSVFFTEGQVFKEVVGSAFYVAPEVLRKRYDKRADIWSLGVLLYILLCGTPPFYAETERDIFQAILSRKLSFEGEVWAAVSEGARDVIRRMIERDPARRASACDVLRHEWVREDGIAAAAPLNNEVLSRLQNFAALNKLQQEALKIIATHLPEAEITGLRAMFAEMDSDGSGSITVEELRQALQRKGTRIPAEELERIMVHADISGDGTLDYEEFLAATMNLAKLERQENLFMAFKFFDADDSGYITREELNLTLHKTCSPTEIDALMVQADSSGDGRIDYSEFCDLMRGGNKTLPRAARTVKQGLMRSHASQVELSRLRLESITALDGLAFSTTTTTIPAPSDQPALQQQQHDQQPPPPQGTPQQQHPAEAAGSAGSATSGSAAAAATAAAAAAATAAAELLSLPSGLPPDHHHHHQHHPTPTPRRLNTTGLSSQKGRLAALSPPLSPLTPPPPLRRSQHQLSPLPVVAPPAMATNMLHAVSFSCSPGGT